MALNDNALVTVAEVRAFTGLTEQEVSDAKLEAYINALSQIIENMTGRKLKAADYTDRYVGTDEQYLILNQWPINSVTSVEYIENDVPFYSYTELEYEILASDGMLYNKYTWRKLGFSSYLSPEVDHPFRYIEVVFNAGYETVPSDLQLVMFQAIEDMIEIDESGARRLKSFAISDTKWDFGNDRNNQVFSSGQASIIMSYKRLRV